MGLMRLEERLSNYASAIRWGYFEQATDFQIEKLRAQAEQAPLKHIHITGYNPTYRHENKDTNTVKQTVEISYFLEQIGVVKTIIDHQTWRFDEQKKEWFLDSPLPNFQ
jgi:hypothetical protein